MRTRLDAGLERYDNDPIFRTFVDHFRAAIVTLHLAPSELRETAMLACYMEEMRRPIDWAAIGRETTGFGLDPLAPR
jgi:hypothetical protein